MSSRSERLKDDFAPVRTQFTTTHWSVVLAAEDGHTPESLAALEKLCRTYWYPLYAHIRRRGYSEEEAQDLTQELFKRLLERRFLTGLFREGGRFRSFLLTALQHFLVENWERSRAQKRGGGQRRRNRESLGSPRRRSSWRSAQRIQGALVLPGRPAAHRGQATRGWRIESLGHDDASKT